MRAVLAILILAFAVRPALAFDDPKALVTAIYAPYPTPGQAAELDAKLGAFQGRMARDRWIEQATLLVAGDRAAYEAAFGKLG